MQYPINVGGVFIFFFNGARIGWGFGALVDNCDETIFIASPFVRLKSP